MSSRTLSGRGLPACLSSTGAMLADLDEVANVLEEVAETVVVASLCTVILLLLLLTAAAVVETSEKARAWLLRTDEAAREVRVPVEASRRAQSI